MSVYTRVERDDLETFLARFDTGALIDYEGIRAGIENTNYFVDTEGGRYVLTLFESLGDEELPFFLGLMAHLAERGVPTAHPLANLQGDYLEHLKGKPAALVCRLTGRSVDHPLPGHCQAIGESLARMHNAGGDYAGQRDNDRGPHWWQRTSQLLDGHLDPAQRRLLDDELAFQHAHRDDRLPRGIVHADLFRDNALFEGERLTGIIDLYYACRDVLLYDVAVTVNDWCSQTGGELDTERAAALLAAYARVRPFTEAEHAAWPVMLRAAALRFWLSRLKDQHFPREGELTHIKDPGEFRRILERRIAETGTAYTLERLAA
mgnify:CR=1 FL=1